MFDSYPLFLLLMYLLFIKPFAGIIALFLTPIYYYVFHHVRQSCFGNENVSNMLEHSICVNDKMLEYHLYYVFPTLIFFALVHIFIRLKKEKTNAG